MKHKLIFSGLLLLALFLALTPAAAASTTWYVNGKTGNDNNNCMTPQTACKTIGHAISLASSGDSIMVAPSTYNENLLIGFSLRLIGSGAKRTIIDGGGKHGVVSIPNTGEEVTLSRVTIQNGDSPDGGGIFNAGRLIVRESAVRGNVAAGNYDVYGGGIANYGTLTIINSTVSGNRALGHYPGFGGGIDNEEGTVTVTNSTINGNSGGFGGGIESSGMLMINSSTITGNSARVRGEGGGIDAFGTATLRNTIVANNPKGGNCAGSGVTSKGYNLSSDDTCYFNGVGDLNHTEPKLGKLGDHGGPTQTIPEELGSPTVDAGNPSGCTDGRGHLLTTDQRGYPRPGKHKTDKRCDMGAFERETD